MNDIGHDMACGQPSALDKCGSDGLQNGLMQNRADMCELLCSTTQQYLSQKQSRTQAHAVWKVRKVKNVKNVRVSVTREGERGKAED